MLNEDKVNEALRWASGNGHSETVRMLLDAGADVHACRDEALHRASENGHSETVKALLDAGADVHADEDLALRWGVLVIAVLKVTISNPMIQLDNVALAARNLLIYVDSLLFAAEQRG